MGGLFEIRLIRMFAIELVVATIIASIAVFEIGRKCRLRLRMWRSPAGGRALGGGGVERYPPEYSTDCGSHLH